jgi:hypothetical protein
MSHTTIGGTSMLIVRVGFRTPAGSVSAITATFNSVSMTAVPSTLGNTSTISAVIFYLINPTIGTFNVVVSWTTAANYVLAATNIYNCNTAPVNGVNATGTSTASTVTVTSAPTHLVLDLIAAGNQTATLNTAGATSDYNTISTTTDITRGAGSDNPGAASIVTSWTLGGSSGWVDSGCDLIPMSSGGNPVASSPYFWI